MEERATVSVFALRSMAGVLARVGVDPVALVSHVGLSPALLANDETRVPAAAVFEAFEEAARRARDPHFALHAAAAIPFGAIGFLEYAARSSPTLREALRCVVRYSMLVNERLEMRIEERGDAAHFVLADRGHVPMGRQFAEFQVAMIFARGRDLLGGHWPLRSVAFTHAAPDSTEEHRRLFEAEVRFAQPVDALVFDRSWLDRPVPTADPVLAAALDRFAEVMRAKLPSGNDVLGDVRRAIAELLRSGETSLEATAAKLRTSGRTLQRKLQALGTSHQDVVDAVRRDLALRWLADDRAVITEVAYLVGFSEPAAFHRAFKRWTGTTPAEYRRTRGHPGAR